MTQNANQYIKLNIADLLDNYRQLGFFANENVEILLELADYASCEVSKLINKFHYIQTNIADNGGVPVLKMILSQLESEELTKCQQF